MDSLSTLLSGLHGQSPRDAQGILNQLVSVLQLYISRPEARSQRLSKTELGGVSVKLLESCGFVEASPGQLALSPGAGIENLIETKEDAEHLLKKVQAKLQADAPAGPKTPRSPRLLGRDGSSGGPASSHGAVAAAPAAAAALQMAAASVSPAMAKASVAPAAMPSNLLSAAPPSPRGARLQSPAAQKTTRTVPQSVVSAAAVVGQAIASASRDTAAANPAAALWSGPVMARRTSSGPGPGAGGYGGSSVWKTAPLGASAEERLVIELPQTEFTYIERPWKHFLTRWAAIDIELERHYGENAFTLVDLGSCCGFFSLQVAAGYPQATVVGVEGSVGIGNGTSGVDGTQDQIIETRAVQTHLRWINRLALTNCFLTPDVWDYEGVCVLAGVGQPICDVLLSLSVLHHVDNVSATQYRDKGMSQIEGTLSLMAKVLTLAPRHFIELPDRPWMEHMYNVYGTAKAFLEVAAAATGQKWSLKGPLCESEWYGHRELWMLEVEHSSSLEAITSSRLKGLFATLLPAKPLDPSLSLPGAITSRTEEQLEHKVGSALPPPMQVVQLPHVVGRAGQPITPAELGAALMAAPSALIAAHIQLRDALTAAEGLLQDVKSLNLPSC